MLTRNELYSAASTSEHPPAAVDDAVSPAEIATALGGSSPTPIQTLLAHARRGNYKPQDVLYHQGTEADTVIFITGGLLKLVAHLANGRARIVRLHRPGSVLGLSGLRGQDNEHTAIAVTPVTALRLPLSAVQRLRVDDPATYVCLAERWHDYLRDADTWIVQFSTGPIRGRVARLLAFLTDFEPDSADRHVQLLTCEEMASVLGVTSESVSRILAEFKRQSILIHHDSSPSEIYEADVDRLQHIADEE